MSNLIFVDCEGTGGAPSVGHLREFGAVHYSSRATFYGKDDSKETFEAFDSWLKEILPGTKPVFVSDNVAYDWQWINCCFWKHLGCNPFGHSGRRISDFYAGLTGNFRNTQKWKRLRITKHDHNPVNDAMGNVEAFERIINGEL
jgi:hypothetical protein